MVHEYRYGKIKDDSVERRKDVVERRKNEAKLVSALEVMFGLLEEYGPTWYSEECHNQALAALDSSRREHLHLQRAA
jgi:hypothetical protein